MSPTISPTEGVSAVIPVYRSASTLPGLVDRLASALAQVTPEFEVILVCDDGLDETWNAIDDLQADRPWLTGIRLMRNYGQHNALLCGIRRARWPLTVTIDDDLQDPQKRSRSCWASWRQATTSSTERLSGSGTAFRGTLPRAASSTH